MKTGKTGFVLVAVLLCSIVSTGAFGSVNDNRSRHRKSEKRTVRAVKIRTAAAA